ncbi:MAG: hypothetical protein U5R48_18915 [Gammaproteobacteria bacterium]|nr:hypothetical protein [Gammaproteobacteria bacterium]
MSAKGHSSAIVIQLLLAFLLAGCSSGPDGASEEAIEKAIGLGLPSAWS